MPRIKKTNDEVVLAITGLFKEKDGLRLLGRIRMSESLDTRVYTLTGYLGRHNGPPIDLRNRTPEPKCLADDRKRVLDVIKPFTDDEIYRAMTSMSVWGDGMEYYKLANRRVVEYYVGNPQKTRRSREALAEERTRRDP